MLIKIQHSVKNLLLTLKDRIDGQIWVDFNKLAPPYEDDWEEIATSDNSM